MQKIILYILGTLISIFGLYLGFGDEIDSLGGIILVVLGIYVIYSGKELDKGIH